EPSPPASGVTLPVARSTTDNAPADDSATYALVAAAFSATPRFGPRSPEAMRITVPDMRSTEDNSPLLYSLTRTVVGEQVVVTPEIPPSEGWTSTDRENSRGLPPAFEIVRSWNASPPVKSVELRARGSTPITGGCDEEAS